MNQIILEKFTCRRCGKEFNYPKFLIIVPNICDDCLSKLIKEGVVKPHVSRRKTAKK